MRKRAAPSAGARRVAPPRPASRAESSPREFSPSDPNAAPEQRNSAQSQLLPQPPDDLEVLGPGKADVEDMKILLRQADATEAVIAFRKVVRQQEVGAAGAVLGLDAVGG